MLIRRIHFVQYIGLRVELADGRKGIILDLMAYHNKLLLLVDVQGEVVEVLGDEVFVDA